MKMKFNPKKRRMARHLALQALYSWQVSQDSAANILAQFSQDPEFKKADQEYFTELLQQVIKQQAEIDQQLSPHLSRSLTELDPIELAILRLGTYELMTHPEIPYRVVINEAVELAKTFGATEGHKFVNGVLDRAAQVIRTDERGHNTPLPDLPPQGGKGPKK